MRVLIAGVEGYLGWPLAQHLISRGHEVAGIDNYARRKWVGEVGSQSAIPISPLGYKPTHDMETELAIVLEDLIPHRSRIEARGGTF